MSNIVVPIKPISNDKTITRFEDIIFKNLVTALQIIGIPLDLSANSSVLRYWSIGFGLTTFLVNLSLNFYSLLNLEKPGNSMGRLNILITEINFSLALAMVQAALLFKTALRWKNHLLPIFQKIEKLDLYLPEDFNRFQKVVTIGSAIMIFTVN